MFALIETAHIQLTSGGGLRVIPEWSSDLSQQTLTIDSGTLGPATGAPAQGSISDPWGAPVGSGDITTGRLYVTEDAAGGPQNLQFFEVLLDDAPVGWLTDAQDLQPGLSGTIFELRNATQTDIDNAVLVADIGYVRTDDNLLTGGDNDDSFVSSDGNDTLIGGGGDDYLRGDAGDDSVSGGSGNDVLFVGAGQDTMEGGDGDDLLQAEDLTGDLFIDLGTQTFTGDELSDDVISGIERVYGGSGDDTIIGSDGRNVIRGDEGADSLDGGGGQDQIRYDYSDAGVEVNLEDETVAGGAAEGDTIANFEDVLGSRFDDTIIGTDFYNAVDGGDGNDSIVLGGGNDWVQGGAGDDTIEGGDGIDRVVYQVSDTGIEIDLEAQTVSGGDADGDVISGFEEVVGSRHDDVILGSEGDNGWLRGLSGNDRIDGRGGNDTVRGEAGDDTLTGGTGNDISLGGSGADLFVLSDGGGDDTIRDFDLSQGDQLDSSALSHPDGRPVHADDVVVQPYGASDAQLVFPNGETLVLQGIAPDDLSTRADIVRLGIPCFTAGTLLQTTEGARAIEEVRTGSILIGPEGQCHRVRWHGVTRLLADDLAARPAARPIHIAEGTLGFARPTLISPQHGLYVPQLDRLVRARHLVNIAGIQARIARGARQVTYHHILVDGHALVVANGAVCETFYPGREALRLLPPIQRAALLAAAPPLWGVHLGADPVQIWGPRIRPLLTGPEARAALRDAVLA